jgi:tetratricopeptide (TPR) repeat protein
MGNLAAFHWMRGELAEPGVLRIEAGRLAEEYGQKGFARWFRGLLLYAEYELGDWDAALTRADAFIAEVEAGAPHYLAAQAYSVRALMRFGRADEEGLASDVERTLALAERAKDPQALYPAIAIASHIHCQQGDVVRAIPLADEFLAAIVEGRGLGFGIAFVHILAWVFTASGQGLDVAAALERYDNNVWARAGSAFGRGDAIGSAEILGGIGAVASEAYCRLTAARQLVEAGRRAEADEQLRRALAFYRSVGAKRYVREGESLLAVSA